LGNPVLPNFTSCNKASYCRWISCSKSITQSPYYNEANKTNIFYSESWALVHYLMLDPARQKEQSLSKYISFVENGADPVEAANRAFAISRNCRRRCNPTSQKHRTWSTSFHSRQTRRKDYSVRTISPAEAQARLGDFDLYRGQLESAQKKLEEAIRLDPNLPAAQESMGLLLFRQDKRYEAERFFSRAVALDFKSALAYYYHAMLLMSQGADAEAIAERRRRSKKPSRSTRD